MNNQLLVTRYVAVEIENIYGKASRLGETAGRLFTGQERSRSQMTNLVNVCQRARTPSDVVSYVKKQAGKHSVWHRDNFAADLLSVIEDDLRLAAKRVADKLPSPPTENDAEFFDIYLRLITDFIGHLVAQYEYSRSYAATANANAGNRKGGRR